MFTNGCAARAVPFAGQGAGSLASDLLLWQPSIIQSHFQTLTSERHAAESYPRLVITADFFFEGKSAIVRNFTCAPYGVSFCRLSSETTLEDSEPQ